MYMRAKHPRALTLQAAAAAHCLSDQFEVDAHVWATNSCRVRTMSLAVVRHDFSDHTVDLHGQLAYW